jgi:hypothetical protein
MLMNLKPKPKKVEKYYNLNNFSKQSCNNAKHGMLNLQNRWYNYPTMSGKPVFNYPSNNALYYHRSGPYPQHPNIPPTQVHQVYQTKSGVRENFNNHIDNISPEIKKNDMNTAKVSLFFLAVGISYLLYDRYYE